MNSDDGIMNIALEYIWRFITHPPKVMQVFLWIAFITLLVLLSIGFFPNRQITLRFDLVHQIIEVQIGAEITQMPANITIEQGKMLVNGIPIRTWLESQGYTVVWDNEAQTAIATPGG
jgi:hypothetical protein